MAIRMVFHQITPTHTHMMCVSVRHIHVQRVVPHWSFVEKFLERGAHQKTRQQLAHKSKTAERMMVWSVSFNHYGGQNFIKKDTDGTILLYGWLIYEIAINRQLGNEKSNALIISFIPFINYYLFWLDIRSEYVRIRIELEKPLAVWFK